MTEATPITDGMVIAAGTALDMVTVAGGVLELKSPDGTAVVTVSAMWSISPAWVAPFDLTASLPTGTATYS